MNLNDAVLDLAPTTPPPCFLNRAQWREYLKSAAHAQSCRGEPKVIIMVKSEPVFNREFPFCDDCTPFRKEEMEMRGTCKPNHLKELP